MPVFEKQDIASFGDSTIGSPLSLNEVLIIMGIPIIINTSFNDKGEPIVESPKDAISCFSKTGIDILVLENYLIEKKTV